MKARHSDRFDAAMREEQEHAPPSRRAVPLSGVAVETNDATGLAVKVAPVRIGGRLSAAKPEFWQP